MNGNHVKNSSPPPDSLAPSRFYQEIFEGMYDKDELNNPRTPNVPTCPFKYAEEKGQLLSLMTIAPWH